jgi:hypothetical protein
MIVALYVTVTIKKRYHLKRDTPSDKLRVNPLLSGRVNKLHMRTCTGVFLVFFGARAPLGQSASRWLVVLAPRASRLPLGQAGGVRHNNCCIAVSKCKLTTRLGGQRCRQ